MYKRQGRDRGGVVRSKWGVGAMAAGGQRRRTGLGCRRRRFQNRLDRQPGPARRQCLVGLLLLVATVHVDGKHSGHEGEEGEEGQEGQGRDVQEVTGQQVVLKFIKMSKFFEIFDF